jgi:hypothetical protein
VPDIDPEQIHGTPCQTEKVDVFISFKAKKDFHRRHKSNLEMVSIIRGNSTIENLARILSSYIEMTH